MNKQEFVVGQKVTVQFGNPGDSSGYEENSSCIILAVMKTAYGTNYLVQKEGQEYVGTASVCAHPEEIAGELYCTNARTYGKSAQSFTGIHTFEQAAKSLGFKVAEPVAA